MKKIILASFLILSVLLFTQPVFAHGNEPRLEISVAKLNPGAPLDLRGVDFQIEKEITISLVGSQVEIPLGIVTADVEGSFVLTITVPVDLNQGIYVIRATTDDHVVESPQITVSGTPVAEDGGGGRLDEETGYGLLAPMPTPAVGVSTPVLQAPSPVEPAQAKRSSLPMVWIASGVEILAVLAMLMKLKK